MVKKSILRLVLVVGLAIVGGSAMSAQGIVPPPSKPATSTQRGKTNTKPTRPGVHQEKKMYSYSEFVNSDFGKWIEDYNIMPFMIMPVKSGKSSSRNRLNFSILSGIMKDNPGYSLHLIGVNASDELKEDTKNCFVYMGMDKSKIIEGVNRNEYSPFIPGNYAEMILFWVTGIWEPAPILFNEDSSLLTDETKLQLYITAQYMKSHDRSWIVSGYTSRQTGTVSSHTALSQKRAEAVVDFLVDECGVNRSDLTIQTIGGWEPFANAEWNNVVLFSEF